MREKQTTRPVMTARSPAHAIKPSMVKPATRTAAAKDATMGRAVTATLAAATDSRRSPTSKAALEPEIDDVQELDHADMNDSEIEMLASVVPRVAGVMSEPRGDSGELGPPPCARPLRRTTSNITTDAEEVRRLRAQLQGMKEQVYFLHKMMQGLSGTEKKMLKGKHLQTENKRLSFAGISPVKKTRGSVDILVIPEEKIPFQDQWKLPTAHENRPLFLDEPSFSRSVSNNSEPSMREMELESRLNALQLQNSALKVQLEQQNEAAVSSEAELQAQIEDLSTKLAIFDAENMQLRSNIEEFEEENLRLHGELAQLANTHEVSANSANNQGNTSGEHGEDAGDLHDELGIDGLGQEPEDIHERCDAKIHELWQTIKTLKAYVETFRVEIEDLRVQRDNAIKSAERAWEENVKLAGNNNPQQKIKYVEVLKQENAALIQKVRELQSKLTKRKYKNGDEGHKANKHPSDSGSEPLDEYPSLDSGDEHSDDGSYEERTKLLKKMWSRNKKLEEEIARLQKEKQALVMRQPRAPSVDSKQSRQSSARSATGSRLRK